MREDEKRLRELLGDESWRVRVFDAVSSTMNLARDECDVMRHDEAVMVLAHSQTEGQGRQGREWISPRGNLFMTLAFHGQGSAQRLSSFTLAAGVVIAEACREASCLVQLKWPNDVLSPDGRKVAGVLCRSLLKSEQVYQVLVGVGLNLTSSPTTVSASLAELGGESRLLLDWAALLSARIREAWSDFQISGFEPFQARWMAYSAYSDRRVAVQTADGVVEGIFRGLSHDGAALIEVDGQERVVWTGTLRAQGE